MKLFVWLALLVGRATSVFLVNPVNNSGSAVSSLASQETFVGWYDAYTTGKGIWKWRNALEAYQTHFARFQGTKVALVEIGVQSGGSATYLPFAK